MVYTPSNFKPFPSVRGQLFFSKKTNKNEHLYSSASSSINIRIHQRRSKKFPEKTKEEREIKEMMMEEDKIDNIVNFLKLYNKEASAVINEIVEEIKENR